jgi:hypothetical protein
MLRRDLFAFNGGGPVDHFVTREAGVQILCDLMLRQPSQRRYLMERAPLSRRRLAETYGVSRAHVNNLFAESPMTRTTDTEVIFHPELSDDWEPHLAATFILCLAAARAVRDGWRYGG